jgi:glycosyltransferase involved in cell wall biosynthesis
MLNKIVFFVTNLDSGGLENYLLRFLRLYSHNFEDIIIFCKGGKTGVLEQQYSSIENVRIMKRKIGNFHPHHYMWLKLWLDRRQDYIVCDFTGNFAGPILWAAKQAKVSKRIVFYRSSSNRFKEDALKLLINEWYNTMVYKYASSIYSNSTHAFDFFFQKRNRDERFMTIYNGLDIKAFLAETSDLRKELGIEGDAFVIGHTGRFNSAKNHRTILDVAYGILKEKEDVIFIMCGKGVKQNLQREIERKGYTQQILLFENRDDVSKFLNTCNAYLFPSITEGQPNSLIEAWVKGLPFVASNIPPIKQLVKEEFYHYLKDPDDVTGISKLLNDIMEGEFNKQKKEALETWASETFDAQLRFGEFYQALIK